MTRIDHSRIVSEDAVTEPYPNVRHPHCKNIALFTHFERHFINT